MSDMLPKLLTEVLNSELEYCAIVVDKPKDVEKIVTQRNLSTDLIYPIYELKESLENCYYDIAFCISERSTVNLLPEKFRLYELPKDKFLHLYAVDGEYNFQVEQKLSYYKNHSTEFEIFSTTHTNPLFGLKTNKFNHKLIDFSAGEQDLYYDYKIAEKILSEKNDFKYALIGLAPYSFNYDQSVGYDCHYNLLQYFIAFQDLHNFHMSAEDYKNLFNEKYLSQKISVEDFNKLEESVENISMPFEHNALVREYVDRWNNRNFPGTRAENIKILDDYLTLCEKNNVRPIMFLFPCSSGFKKHFSNERLGEFHKIINDALQKHMTAKFFDGWKIQGFSDENFYDAEHFNLHGAENFSVILNEFIKN